MYFSRNKYKVTLNLGTGIQEIEDANTYYYEAPVSINAKVKEGYTWSKWESTQITESSNTTYEFTMPAKDVELTATATINEYEITYDLVG